MEVHELVNKVRNNLNNESLYIEDLIKWCDENAEKIDLSNSDQMFLCESVTKYLMENKEQRVWSTEDAKYIINFLAKKTIKEWNLDQNVSIQILDEEEYEKRYGNRNTIVRGICVPQTDKYSKVSYSPEVIKDLTSDNKWKFLEGMQTIFHEIRHVQQNKSISNEVREDGTKLPVNKERYLSALESVARKLDEPFYKANYRHLLKENDADKAGLLRAYNTIRQYAPNLCKKYNTKPIQDKLEEYDKNYYEAISNAVNGNYSLKKEIDTRASKFIEKNPEMIKSFPILQMGFHEDGTKKDIIELLEDRKEILTTNIEQESIDELYGIIANHRNITMGGLNGFKDEVLKLEEYVKENGAEDKFVYELSKSRFEKIMERLENKTNLTKEQIENYLNTEYPNLSKVYYKREKQEIEHEESESIKDEVGDEFKSKTKQQEQEEQEVETMWQNRFQSWDMDAIKLPNSATRKVEAIHIMKNIEKEKELEEQRKLQESKEQEEIEERR